MFRSAILNLVLHRNTCSSSAFAGSFDSSIKSNLEWQRYYLKINNYYDTKNERNDYSSSSSFMSKKFVDHSSNEYELSYSGNSLSSKRNTLATGTSSFLTAKYSRVRHPRLGPLGARHFSSEATVHVPLVKLTGIWKSLSESAPVEFAQETLINVQSATNLPWWATIILTTFIVRSTVTMPLHLYQYYIMARIQKLNSEMNEIIKRLKADANAAVAHRNWSEHKARFVYERMVKRKWDELIQRDNCHPAKAYIVLWAQIPLWITISSALRNICCMLPATSMNAEKVFLDLTTGGFGWIVNLVDVDHYWIIPISVGIVNLMNVEIMTLMRVNEQTKLQKYMLYFFRSISIAIVPLATYVPACISLYWLSSSTFGLVQNLALLSPKIRRLAGVPLTSSERANPYRHLIAQIKAKKYFNFSPKSKDF